MYPPPPKASMCPSDPALLAAATLALTPSSPCPLPPQFTTDTLSVTLNQCFLEFHKQEVIHYMCSFFGMSSFRQHNSFRSSHFETLLCYVSQQFIPLYSVVWVHHSLFIHSLVDGYICLLGVPLTKYHKLGVFNSRNSLSHSSRGQKSESKVSAALVPPEGYERESVPGFSPWLVNNFPHVQVFSLYVYLSPNFPFL